MSADRPAMRRHYVMDPLPPALRTLPPKERGRGLALAYILAGLFGAAASASVFLGFVQTRLHFQCGPATGGFFGYLCPNGLAYFPFGTWVYGAYAVVAVIAALILAPQARRSRLRRIRARLLAVAALIPNAIFAYAIGSVNPPEAELYDSLLVPGVLLGTATLAILIAALVPVRLVLWTCVFLAMVLCIAAAIVEPGYISTASMTFGILVAVLILDYRRSLIR
jgi:MFS family permease